MFRKLRPCRQAQGMYRDIDYDVIRSPCLHSNLIFGKPKYLAVHQVERNASCHGSTAGISLD